jgi:CBS domain-containing protein
MTAVPVVTVGPATVMAEVARRMDQQGVSHLVVVERGRVVGVVCACDLDRAELGAKVGDHMARPPRTLPLGTSVFAAARDMIEHDLGCLPVMDGARLAGIVTRSDLRRAGILERDPQRCAACGDDDHVRCARPGAGVGFCLQCTRSSRPPRWDEDLGGG